MSQTNWIQHKPLIFEYNGKWIKNWFSNIAPSPIFVGSEWEWPSVENYYQAMKTEHMPTQEAIRQATPSQSKQMGKRVRLRPHWEDLKESFMKRALHSKFSQPPWFDLLMKTGDTPIIEWNNWGDTYWGVDYKTGQGLNRLGVLLMEIRAEYQEISKQTQAT